jgi:4-hydroxybenzoate polyprenyltransferase
MADIIIIDYISEGFGAAFGETTMFLLWMFAILLLLVVGMRMSNEWAGALVLIMAVLGLAYSILFMFGWEWVLYIILGLAFLGLIRHMIKLWILTS